jgi:hypothetical protein
LDTNEVETDENNQPLSFTEREWCEAYIKSRGWEHDCKVIEIIKSI